MKVKILLAAALCATAIAAYKYNNHRIGERCEKWFAAAQLQEKRAFYARAIEQLTLYFAQDKCRGANDPEAVQILTRARVKVPLAGNAHLAQQVMLSKYGWHLRRNDEHHVRMASVNLIANNWMAAHRFAKKAKGAQAALIELVSAVNMANRKASETAATRLAKSQATGLQLAMARIMLERDPDMRDVARDLVRPHAAYSKLAIKILEPTLVNYSVVEAASIRTYLSNDDLAVASSLLRSSGSLTLATILLDQPDRQLPATLLTRLVDLFWLQQKDQFLNAGFLNRSQEEMMPAEAYFAVCVQELRNSGKCTYRFDQETYRARYGDYAAGNWGTLLRTLSAEQLDPSDVLKAMEGMTYLQENSGLSQILASAMYIAIEEPDLALAARKKAMRLGHAGVLNELLPKKIAPNCEERDLDCLERALADNPDNYALWRTALNSGLSPDATLAQSLKEKSPKSATLWRTINASLALKQDTDKSAAEALRLLRPVLNEAPKQSVPHLIAASATARFKDLDTAYMHLANAVKTNPDKAVPALRLTLGFYENDPQINLSSLVTWWQKLTRLEMLARGETIQGNQTKKLVLERLAILAAYSEQNQDHKLAETVYRAILAINPESHMALNNLAYKMFELKHSLEEALAMSAKAVSLAPDVDEYKNTQEQIQAAMPKKVS